MKAVDRLKIREPLESGIEVAKSRFGKKVNLGNDRHRIVLSRNPIYTADGGELDDTLVAKGDKFVAANLDFQCEIDPNHPSFTYTKGSDVAVLSLRAPAPNGFKVDDNTAIYTYDNHEIIIEVRSGQIKTVRKLLNNRAPKSFVWDISGNKDIPAKARGWDANRNKCEMVVTNENGVFTDTWTGRVSVEASKRTRQRRWQNAAKYPVFLDPSVTDETIEHGAGREVLTTATTAAYFEAGNIVAGIATASKVWGGLRFLAINVPKNATIESATLSLFKNNSTGSGTLHVFADDVDNAGPFGETTDLPSGITKTTATASFTFNATTTTGTEEINVAPIISEITSRSGWASGNNMRFAITHTGSAGASHNVEFAAGGDGPDDSAVLDITYTLAGGAPNLVDAGLVR